MDTITAVITTYGGEIAALTAAFFWAFSSMLFDRVGKRIRPVELNILKCVLAILLFTITLLISGESFTHINLWARNLLLLSGAIGIGLGDTAFFLSLNHLGARRLLLLSTLAPPMTGVLAAIFLGERLSGSAWLGIVITLAGVAWVITERTPEDEGHANHLMVGLGFGLVAALTQATGAVLSRAALSQTDVSALQSGLIRLIAGLGVPLLWLIVKRQPFGRWARGEKTASVWMMVLGATLFGTYLGIWLQQTSLKLAPAGIALTLISTSPLFVLPLAWRTGEKISIRAVSGALVALVGVAILFGLQ